MRAIVTGFGSTGDVLPMIALAIELQRNGHRPRVMLSSDHAPLVAPYGLEFAPLDDGGGHSVSRGIIQSELAAGIRSPSQSHNLLPIDQGPLMVDRLCAQAREADVLISGTQFPVGPIVHKLTGAPYVAINVARVGSEYAGYNRFNFLEQQLAVTVNQFRRSYDLPPVANPMVEGGNSDQLTIFAMSSAVLDPAREASWPDHYKTAGFFFVNELEWTPDPALVAFLEAGEPPLLISFGSMVHGDPAEMTRLLVGAVQESGYRAIIQQGWSGLGGQGEDDPSIFLLRGFVPFGWLFARTACVIHHGGVGTLSWALRSGVPSIVIPHLWDQFALARFVEASHCGRELPYEQLSVDELATAIDTVMGDGSYRRAAQTMKARIGAEHGVQTARVLIEDLVGVR